MITVRRIGPRAPRPTTAGPPDRGQAGTHPTTVRAAVSATRRDRQVGKDPDRVTQAIVLTEPGPSACHHRAAPHIQSADISTQPICRRWRGDPLPSFLRISLRSSRCPGLLSPPRSRGRGFGGRTNRSADPRSDVRDTGSGWAPPLPSQAASTTGALTALRRCHVVASPRQVSTPFPGGD